MYTLTMTYPDFNGVERTEDFQFNMTKAELMEKELSTAGGWAETVKAIVAAKDVPTLIDIFKTLILGAYGKKSPDGRRFVKSKELSDEFSQTEAYSQLFMKLATDADAAAKFMNGIVPADLRQQIPLPDTATQLEG